MNYWNHQSCKVDRLMVMSGKGDKFRYNFHSGLHCNTDIDKNPRDAIANEGTVEVDSPQIYLFGQDWNIRYFSASE